MKLENPKFADRFAPPAARLAAVLAAGLALAACEETSLLLPDGSEVTLTASGEFAAEYPPVPSCARVSFHTRIVDGKRVTSRLVSYPGRTNFTPEEAFANAFRGAHDMMRQSPPGSPLHQRGQDLLASSERRYREQKRIEQVGYARYIEERLDEHAALLSPAKRRELFEYFGPLLADAKAREEAEGTATQSRASGSARDEECLPPPVKSNFRIVSREPYTGYNPDGDSVWVIVYEFLQSDGTPSVSWHNPEYNIKVSEIVALCDYDPATGWPDCPGMPGWRG